MSEVRDQRSEIRDPASTLLTSPLAWLPIFALLCFPIFAHGCHREDVDDEPGFIPSISLSKPEPQ
jgi:hypothetical protein